jgi:hypothetical protein
MIYFDDFNWLFYVNYYEDLYIFNNYDSALKHWNKYGQFEDRICNFDWMVYINYHKDIKNSGITTMEEATIHWINYGKREKRQIFFTSPILTEINNDLNIKITNNHTLCLFACYNTDNNINDNMLYARILSKYVDYLIIISNIDYPVENNIYLLKYKTNIGLDYGIYLRAFNALNKNIINYPKELFLINDSCAIHNNLTPFYIWSKQYNNCLLGMTANDTIHYHIQSFFLYFKGDTVKLCFDFMKKCNFNQLLSDYHPENYYKDYIKKNYNIDADYKFYLIVKYEIGLSQYILNKKYKLIPYVNTKLSIFWNPIEMFDLIPISKKKIINSNPVFIEQFNYVKRRLKYIK